jgi:phage baseplate assembly protein W
MTLDKRGLIKKDESQAARDQSTVMLVLGTAVGERVMRPQYGSSAAIFEDDVPDKSGKSVIREAISEAFLTRLPSLELTAVEFDKNFGSGTHMVNVGWFRRKDGPINIQSGRVDVSGYVDKLGQ